MAFAGIDFTGYRRSFRNFSTLADLVRQAKEGTKTLVFLHHTDSNGHLANVGSQATFMRVPRCVASAAQNDSVDRPVPNPVFELNETNIIRPRMVTMRRLTTPSPFIRNVLSWNISSSYPLDFAFSLNDPTPIGSVFPWFFVEHPPTVEDANFNIREHATHVYRSHGLIEDISTDNSTWRPEIGYVRWGSTNGGVARDDSNQYNRDTWGKMCPALRPISPPYDRQRLVMGGTTGVVPAAGAAWDDNIIDTYESPNTWHDLVNLVCPEFQRSHGSGFSGFNWGFDGTSSTGPVVLSHFDFIRTKNPDDSDAAGGLCYLAPYQMGGRAAPFMNGFMVGQVTGLAYHLGDIYKKLTALGDDVVFIVMVNQGLNDRGTEAPCNGPLDGSVDAGTSAGFLSEMLFTAQIYEQAFGLAGIPRTASHYHYQVSHPAVAHDEYGSAAGSTRNLWSYRRAFHNAFSHSVLDSRFSFCDLWSLVVPDDNVANSELMVAGLLDVQDYSGNIDLKFTGSTDTVFYCHITNEAGEFWNGNTFEAYNASNWEDYSVPLTYQSGTTWREAHPGQYPFVTSTYTFYIQSGANPAPSDTKHVVTAADVTVPAIGPATGYAVNNSKSVVDGSVRYARSLQDSHLCNPGFTWVWRNWWGALRDEANALGPDNDVPAIDADVLTEEQAQTLRDAFAVPTAGRLGSRIWA